MPLFGYMLFQISASAAAGGLPSFDLWTSNLPSTPSNTPGTILTANGSANTKGSWVTLITPNFDVSLLVINIGGTVASATVTGALVDIGTGAVASEVVLFPNLLGGWAYQITNGHNISKEIIVPCDIPANTRIAARVQSAVGGSTAGVIIYAFGSSVPAPANITAMDAYGPDTSASHGVNLTPDASAGTFGSWTNIGSPTSRDYKALIPMYGGNVDDTATNEALIVEFGESSTAFARYAAFMNILEGGAGLYPPTMIQRAIPAGTQLQARIKSSEASGEAKDFALYGIY